MTARALEHEPAVADSGGAAPREKAVQPARRARRFASLAALALWQLLTGARRRPAGCTSTACRPRSRSAARLRLPAGHGRLLPGPARQPASGSSPASRWPRCSASPLGIADRALPAGTADVLQPLLEVVCGRSRRSRWCRSRSCSSPRNEQGIVFITFTRGVLPGPGQHPARGARAADGLGGRGPHDGRRRGGGCCASVVLPGALPGVFGGLVRRHGRVLDLRDLGGDDLRRVRRRLPDLAGLHRRRLPGRDRRHAHHRPARLGSRPRRSSCWAGGSPAGCRATDR